MDLTRDRKKRGERRHRNISWRRGEKVFGRFKGIRQVTLGEGSEKKEKKKEKGVHWI